MKIPSTQITISTQKVINQIIQSCKNNKHSIGEQTVMANYYAYLHSKAATEYADFAKILLLR